MTLLLALILLALHIGPSTEAKLTSQTGRGTVRPVVTLTPNFGDILVGDLVTLTCHVASGASEEPTYRWYRDHQPIPEGWHHLVIETSSGYGSGDYQCRTNAGDISDPVTLTVINEHLILQTPPPPIYEGDPLTLRCHHRNYFTARNSRFYKDGVEIRSSGSELLNNTADINSSGTYGCTKRVYDTLYGGQETDLSAVSRVTVRELFSPPTISGGPTFIVEGREMTLTCDTTLDPPRRNTNLQFAFYRDGHAVREFEGSYTYQVLSTKLEDSGNYTCVVRTPSDTVRKTSNAASIVITSKNVFVAILSVAAIGIAVVIVIISAFLIWRCKRRRSSSREELHPAPTTSADTGSDLQNDSYASLDIASLKKASTRKEVQDEDLTIIYAVVNKNRGF